MMNTSFGRFSWLAVLLGLTVKVVWMGFIWKSSLWTPSNPSNSRFSYQVSRTCVLHCRTKPRIHNDALEYTNQCVAFLHAGSLKVQFKTETILKEILRNLDKFQVECDSRGSEKSFYLTEELKNQESIYLVIVMDTSNCSVVRLENFCEFTERTEVLNKVKFLEEES